MKSAAAVLQPIAAVADPSQRSERIDICICTFRRPDAIAQAMLSVARQILPPGFSVRLVIADNDQVPSAEASVRATAERLGLDVRYVHAPFGNISIARNACLAAAEADWLAFIDDDEIAAPEWLANLLAAREGADVVFGPVTGVLSPDAPRWMVEGAYHSNVLREGRLPASGYTGNVLIRRALLEGLRFDPELGQVGGEDTLLFHDLKLRGARLAASPKAVVHEPVPLARQSAAWIFRRRFRSGQTHALLQARFHPSRALPTAAASVAKIAYSLLSAAATVWSPTRRMRNLFRAVFHCGVLSYFLNGRFVNEYRAAPPSPSADKP